MRAFILFLALLLSVPFSGQAQINNLLADTLRYTLDHLAQQYQLKGVTAAVVFPDSSTWSAAKGHYGTSELQTDLLYEIGSNTKTFVSTIILQMEAEGLLLLDDPLSDFIDPTVNVLPEITLRQLLNHSSGIYNYTDHPDISAAILADMTHVWNIDSLLANFVDVPDFAPGTSWGYSNTNYLLLGKVIEAVDGKPFHESLRERILTPQQLDETFLSCYESFGLTRAGTWLSNGFYFGLDFKSFMSAAWAAGGLLATPDDLADWAFRLYGGRVLPSASFKKMTDSIHVSSTYSYGLGMSQRVYKGRVYYGHGGTTLQSSEMEFSRETGFSCVVILIEENSGSASALVRNALIDVLESEIPKAVSTLAVSDMDRQRRGDVLSVFPNPATDRAIVRVNEGVHNQMIASIFVYDAFGKQVKHYATAQNQVELHRDETGTGVFYIVMHDENGNRTGSQKLVFINPN